MQCVLTHAEGGRLDANVAIASTPLPRARSIATNRGNTRFDLEVQIHILWTPTPYLDVQTCSSKLREALATSEGTYFPLAYFLIPPNQPDKSCVWCSFPISPDAGILAIRDVIRRMMESNSSPSMGLDTTLYRVYKSVPNHDSSGIRREGYNFAWVDLNVSEHCNASIVSCVHAQTSNHVRAAVFFLKPLPDVCKLFLF